MQTNKIKYSPRIKLGRDQVGGFFGLSDGDCFEGEDGAIYLLKPYNGGWALRPVAENGSVDFLAPVHPAFNAVDYSGFISVVNQIYAANH
jgi:hypothetical protein